MKIENDMGNLIFDDSLPDCRKIITQSQGQLFAFIVCLDIGVGEKPFKKPIKNHYWGKFSWENEHDSIRSIMANGGKWPDLKK